MHAVPGAELDAPRVALRQRIENFTNDALFAILRETSIAILGRINRSGGHVGCNGMVRHSLVNCHSKTGAIAPGRLTSHNGESLRPPRIVKWMVGALTLGS